MITKRSLLFVSLGTTLWFLFMVIFTEPSISLRPELKDHISNLDTTVLFWHRGSDVFTKSIFAMADAPTGNVEELARKFSWSPTDIYQIHERIGRRPLMTVWPDMPRPYPPGLYLVLSPFAALSEAAALPLEVPIALSVLLYLLAAHGMAVVVWRTLQPIHRYLRLLVVAIVYVEAVKWSVASQYDALPALFLALALSELRSPVVRTGRSVLSAAISSFLSFRILFFAPVMVVGVCRSWRSVHWRRDAVALALSGLLIAVSAVEFVSLLPQLRAHRDVQSTVLTDLMNGTFTVHTSLFLAFTLVVVIWSWRTRESLLLTLIGWLLLMHVRTPFLRGWYCVFLTMIFMVWDNRRPTNAGVLLRLATYLLFAIFFYSNSPFELELGRQVVNAILRH